MSTRIALLRAVNVSGTGKLAMADLRAFFKALGHPDARTLLQTGNVVFTARDGNSPAELEATLEREARDRLGLGTCFFVRDAKEWRSLVADNPFPKESARDPARAVALLLKEAVAEERVEDLRAAIAGPETVAAAGRTLYALYPDGQGRSKLTLALIERRLGTRATARNWNTVLKIAKLAGT
ncbi:MAG: DUF1697 domain-containing protein [Hyphomicrobiales bacterium]